MCLLQLNEFLLVIGCLLKSVFVIRRATMGDSLLFPPLAVERYKTMYLWVCASVMQSKCLLL